MKLSDTTSINLPALLESRLLVQANSGGGKSWALRRLLEQTAPHVQQLIIDPEGEFSTLREKFDYVIAAPHDGDAVATPKTAALLARRLLESGVSAILDIYDLKAHERQQFVKRFLDALINAPRALWHPVMVVVDEAHTFAPQNGSAEALSSVIDLATRGRKRGQCLVLATQRLSKLHKDAAAEMLNKLVGRTGLDVDVKRAADELGFTPRDAMELLRNLAPGEFYAFGPALTPIVTKLRIGQVQTTHPKAGDRLMQAPPAPSKRVLASLAKLADLQKEADVEAATVEQLQTQTADLRRKLTVAERKASTAGVPEAEVLQRIAAAVKAASTAADSGHDAGLEVPALQKALRMILSRTQDIESIVRQSLQNTGQEASPGPVARSPAPRSPAPARTPVPSGPVSDGVTAPQQRILDTVAQMESFGVPAPNKSVVAVHASVSPKSSGFANNLGALRSKGLIDYPSGGHIALTATGRTLATFPAKPPTLADLHASWLAIVTRPQAAILTPLIERYPAPVAKSDLADLAGVSGNSSGYANNLGFLRTLGAIDYPQKGMVRATDLLFPAVK
jgi:uncharacterized protein DUF87